VFVQFGVSPSELSVSHPDPEVRSRARALFRSSLQFCVELGCKHMTGLPGTLQPGQDVEQAFALAAVETSWRVALAESLGVRYSVEPHLESLCDTPAKTLRMLAAVRGLSLTLDYGHFISASIDAAEVHALIPHASHLHARGSAPGKLQAPVSENTIDFAAVIQQLLQRSFSGFVCLEYVWTDWHGCNRTDNLSETLLLRSQLQIALQQDGLVAQRKTSEAPGISCVGSLPSTRFSTDS
jgi:sugar phosphate isomerase/epimerase